MDLDELKNAWASVDERLKKQEILNECIVREMTYKKTNKSLRQLFWSDSISIPVLFFVIPFIVYEYGKFGGKHIFWDSTIIVVGIICIAFLPFIVYRVYGLMKVDLFGNFKNNLYYMNRYNIQVKWDKIIMAFLGPGLAILVTLMLVEAKANAFRWTLWICGLIFVTIYSYWSYKKIYDKNIQSIRKSLDELKELKEE